MGERFAERVGVILIEIERGVQFQRDHGVGPDQEVVGRREILVKPLPPPLGRLRPYAGAAVLENGSIVLIVDPLQLR